MAAPAKMLVPPSGASEEAPRKWPSRAAAMRERRRRMTDLCFGSEAELVSLQERASLEGCSSFNEWLLTKLDAGLSGNTYSEEYVQNLLQNIEKNTRWLAVAREEREGALREAQTLRSQRDRLLALLMDTSEGAELAQSILREGTTA